MSMRKKAVLAVFLLALAIAGAWFLFPRSQRISVTPPVQVPAALLPDPPVSTLSFPLSVSLDELRRLARNRLPEEISGANAVRESLFDGRGTYLVRREGEPDVKVENDRLVLSVPVNFRARLNGTGTALGISLPVSLSAEGAATVELSMKPSVSPDWRVRTQPKIAVKWKRAPSATVLGIRVTFQGAADEFLRRHIEESLPRIDSAVNESLNLRERAEAFWREIQEPRPVSSSPDLWLTVRPLSVTLPPLRLGPEKVFLDTRIQARLSLATNKPPSALPVPLPPVSSFLEEGSPAGFTLELPVFLGYDAVNAKIESALSNRTFAMGEGRTLKVRKISVSANGSRLAFAIDVEALEGAGIFSSRRVGTVYVLGKPQWDPARQVIRLDSVDFDEGTSRGLVCTAAWIGRPLLLEILRQSAVFPLSEPAAQAEKALGRFLEKQEIGSGLTLRGSARQVALDSVSVTREGLALLLRLVGETSLEWNPEKP